jgi:copper resistance protein C
MTRPFILAILAVAVLAVAARDAKAHAFLDRAIPAVGSTLRSPPPEVSIWFTQELEPAFSAIEITNEKGNRVDENDPHVDQSDPTLLHVSLKQLVPGTYRVHWHVLSVDTHRTEGNFSFTVAP